MKNISILGSTGSIGQSALDVVRAHPDKLRVVGLAAGANADLLLQQALEFQPAVVAMASEDALGWPHRRIASVLGGVCHLRCTEFAGRRPYRFNEPGGAASRRWEMWMDAGQARAVRSEQLAAARHP